MAATRPVAALPSLQALLAGVIDYAGLFPPAALPLDQSIRNYAQYLLEPEAWMLARFICPAGRLGELQPHVEDLFSNHEPFSVSALGRTASFQDFEEALDADLDAIASFRTRTSGRAAIDVLEIRAPDPAIEISGRCAQVLARRCAAAGLRPFLEVGLAGDWARTIPPIARVLAEHGVGFKLRTGGVEAAAFPSTAQVAAVIIACRDAGCALKFTAGLHHPVRHYDQALQASMHGFINVFAAAALAHACTLAERQVGEMLKTEDACCFRFRDYGLSFGEHAISTEQIAAARRELAISFGSCSFDEPREDLRKLGLL